MVISSGMGSIQDNGSGKALGYRTSKVGINGAMQNMMYAVPEAHTILLCPGLIFTD